MSNQNSIGFNYYDDDSFQTKTQSRSKILVKHDKNRPKSKPLSGKRTAEPELLERKVEDLEKKQELWRERNQVWGKQKKTYEKALLNVAII